MLILSLSGREVGWGGCLLEAGWLLTFSTFRMGANSRLGAYSNKYGMSNIASGRRYLNSFQLFLFKILNFSL